MQWIGFNTLGIKRCGSKIITVVAKHNLREMQAELGSDSHIDADRIKDNVIIFGASTSHGAAQDTKNILKDVHPSKIRVNAVLGIKIVITLPNDSAIDELAYFTDTMNWAVAYFEIPLLSAIWHKDESTPHAHIILVPLYNGELKGSNLLSGIDKLAAIKELHLNQVCKHYGIVKPIPAKRVSVDSRRKLLDSIIYGLLNNLRIPFRH